MLKNYIKIAFRNLRKNPVYSFINISGLAVGIACCLLIGMYVWHEWSYDDFHTKKDRLYRLTYENRIGENLPPATPEEYKAWGSAAIAPVLEQDFPEVEETVRLSGHHSLLITRDDRAFQEERYFFADPGFFKVFSYQLLQGDPETALVQPNSIILTETAARRYFGEENALGKTLELAWLDDSLDLTVTGVMEDVPSNTHLDFNMLLSMSTFENQSRANDRAFVFENWGYIDFFTYVLLDENATSEAVQSKLPAFVKRHNADGLEDPPATYNLALEPIMEAYLSPVSGFQPGPKGNETSLYLFSFIGLFILLIACVNFMNLTTARSAGRAKEVGIRKTVGARRSRLVFQFLAEAILLATVATALSVLLAELAFPLFSHLAGKEIPGTLLTSLPVLGLLAVGTLVVGILAGSYPALVLSDFRPSQVLKGSFSTSSRGVLLRKGLVVFQFSTAIALIIGTFVVIQQLNFLQNQSLGFDDTQQLVLDFGGDMKVLENTEAIEQELSTLPGVRNVSSTRSIPGGYYPHATTNVETPEGALRQMNLPLYEVDHEFLAQIGVDATAGRLFDKDYSTDAEEALLLNEAAVQELGYADPANAVGKRFEQWGRSGEVVGVVKNFNYESLRNEIRPLSFRVSTWLNYFVLEVDTENASDIVADVRAKWSELAPHRPFLFSFLDQSFDSQYRAEEQFGTLFGTFAVLAIFIACLGLFGLAAFGAQQRTKEIGIRKVFGATITNIVGLLSKDFMRLVLIGFAISVPVAWFFMNRWLADFAYRTEIGPGIFLAAGSVALLIALGTVSWQSVKAALMDPVNSLRNE